MTRAEAVRAVETGIRAGTVVRRAQSTDLLCGGEMGIGNTTTSAAVTAALTGADVHTVTGRGAGLSSAGLARKVRAIQTALALHQPRPGRPARRAAQGRRAGYRGAGGAVPRRGGLRSARSCWTA